MTAGEQVSTSEKQRPSGIGLGHLLFNIYIQNISSTTSRKYAYADDLALLHSSGDWKGLEKTLSQDMVTQPILRLGS